ncbi:MAG: hypothetical protein Q9169_000203 [Polycauliona sp. 2 TL-2023]
MASLGKVLATGFNLHGQLESGALDVHDNLHHFTQIHNLDLAGCSSDRVVGCALWSATVINTGTHFIHHGTSGSGPDNVGLEELVDVDGKPRQGVFFGDVSGVKGFLEDDAGDLYILQHGANDNAKFVRHPFRANDFLPRTGKKIAAIAIAGNLQVCIAFGSNHPGVSVFFDLESLLQGSDPIEISSIGEAVGSFVASSTTFTALGRHHCRVETFGDARYPSLLGRIPSPQSPASLPTVVSALDGIDIAKIAAGSWLMAAVSREKDLYVWGHVMQQPLVDSCSGFQRLLETIGHDGMPEDVHLIDVADGQDVEDAAVGDEHLVVLTANGELWGYGSNESGQLGLGREVKSTQGKWVKVYSAKAGETIREIAAGPLSTFVVVGCGASDRETRSDADSGNCSGFAG